MRGLQQFLSSRPPQPSASFSVFQNATVSVIEKPHPGQRPGAVSQQQGAALELEIDVYNVNEGRNSGILEACAELKGYAYFVHRVRAHEKELAARGEKPGGALCASAQCGTLRAAAVPRLGRIFSEGGKP